MLSGSREDAFSVPLDVFPVILALRMNYDFTLVCPVSCVLNAMGLVQTNLMITF